MIIKLLSNYLHTQCTRYDAKVNSSMIRLHFGFVLGICLCGRLNRVYDKRISMHFVRSTRAHVSNALTTIQQQNSPSFCLSMCINTRTGCRARIDRWHIRSDQPTEFRFRPIIPIGDNFVCKQLPCVIIIIWMIDQDDFNTSSVSSFCHTARYSRCARCAKYFSTYDKLFVYEIFASFFSLPLIYASWFFSCIDWFLDGGYLLVVLHS